MAKRNQFAYAAEVVKCWAGAAMERTGEMYRNDENAQQHGVMVRLTRVPRTTFERR